jgi:hypothetical protein
MNKTHDIVTAIEAVLRAYRGQNANMLTAWAAVLDVPAGGADFTLGMVCLQAKFDNVGVEVAAASVSEKAKGLYQGALKALRPFVEPHRMNALDTNALTKQRQQIDILHLAVDALPHVLVPEVNELTISSLMGEINELLVNVEGSAIDEPLKHLLKAHLSTLLMALHSYEILGQDGVARVYGSVAAELVRVSRTPEAQSKGAKALFGKALKVAKAIGAVVVWASATVSGADGLLTHGSDLLGWDGDAGLEGADGEHTESEDATGGD